MSDAPSPGTNSPAQSKAPLLFALLNTLGVLAAVGTLVYTKFMFKRPAITEAQERESRLTAAEQQASVPTQSASVTIDPMTVNIRGGVAPANPKMHYVTLGFSLELRDDSRVGEVDAIKPKLVDRVLQLLGNKGFSELNTVQGRYVLRTEVQDISNSLIREQLPEDSRLRKVVLVSAVYLTQFTLQ